MVEDRDRTGTISITRVRRSLSDLLISFSLRGLFDFVVSGFVSAMAASVGGKSL